MSKSELDKSTKTQILNKFPTDLQELLIEFTKHIASIEADYIIFMARKAIRLYDLLIFAGAPYCKQAVLSDHVLDQNLSRFKNKTVALIDDTLILGTTLGRSKKYLIDAGAKKVTTHVFAVDEDFWCKELVQPEKYMVSLTHDRMLTFCAAEVSGLSALAIPYLTDFPFSKEIRVGKVNLSIIQSMNNWETHNLTTPQQYNEGAVYHSFLPATELIDSFFFRLNLFTDRVIDIMKVRTFSRKTKQGYYLKMVPIVTFTSMNHEAINSIFTVIVEEIFIDLEESKRKLYFNITNVVSKLRFIQYMLSYAFGSLFSKDIQKHLGLNSLPDYDIHESIRHYGQWLHREFEIAHSYFDNKKDLFFNSNVDLSCVKEKEIPSEIIDTVQKDYEAYVGLDHPDKNTKYGSRTMLTDLIQAFNALYEHHELPARSEVKKFKSDIFDIDLEKVPHRERLNYGFPWKVLTKYLSGNGLPLSRKKTGMLTLLLDYLIDMGIAVPILCNKDGLIFRAYRHGEDVKFGEQEVALSFDVIDGFMQGSNSTTIANLPLEKALVLMIRIGAAKKFLEVVHGASGNQGIARIGYHLHGAVPFLPKQETYLADNTKSWLSRYLLDRKILKVKKGQFYLGIRPEAALKTQYANTEAIQIGFLLGMLHKKSSFLKDQNLTLLATCYSTSDTVGALSAEVNIFNEFAERKIIHSVKLLNWSDVNQMKSFLKRIHKDHGYTAINSAKMKYVGYKSEQNIKTIENCSGYLSSLENGMFLKQSWDSYWSQLSNTISVEKEQQFLSWLNQLASHVTLLSLGIFSIELAIVSQLYSSQVISKSAFTKSNQKVNRYLSEISGSQQFYNNDEKLLNRLLDVTKNNTLMESPQASAVYGAKWLSQKLPSSRLCAIQSLDLLSTYGRTEARHNFKYVVWYDVIDSTGQKSGLIGESLNKYRCRVREFKEGIASDLYTLIHSSKSDNTIIHCWHGHIDSKDDEKHIFMSGSHIVNWAQAVLTCLINRCRLHNIEIRMVIVRADFTGVPAYFFRSDARVEGESFFEHFDRIKKSLRDIENDNNEKSNVNKSPHPILWVQSRLYKELKLNSVMSIDNKDIYNITSKIEGAEYSMPFRGGRFTQLISDG